MHLYWIVFLIVAPLFGLKQRTFFYLGFVALSLSLFSALQSIDVSTDRATYIDFYQSAEDGSLSNSLFVIEPFFQLIFRGFSGDPALQILGFFIVCFIGISAKFYLISKYSQNIPLSCVLFISYLFLLQDMNQIRIGAALGFIYCAIISFYKGKKGIWLACSMVSMCFHFSAVLSLFAPLYVYRRLDQKKLLFVVTLLVVLALLWLPLGAADRLVALLSGLDPTGKLKWYLANSTFDTVNPVKRLLPHLLFLIPIIIKFPMLCRVYPLIKLFVPLYLIYIASFILLSPIPVLAYRVSDIFLFSSIFVIPSIVLVVRQKSVAKLLVFAFAVFQFVYLIYQLEIFGSYSIAPI